MKRGTALAAVVTVWCGITTTAAALAWQCESHALGIGGIEDIALDRVAGQAILSAYDRQAVRAALTAHAPNLPEGGLYRLDLAMLRPGAPPRPVPLVLDSDDRSGGFRPHGLELLSTGNGTAELVVVNRAFAHDAAGWRATPQILTLALAGDRLVQRRAWPAEPPLCRPNGVAALPGNVVLASNDHGSCGFWWTLFERVIARPWSQLWALTPTGAKILAQGFGHANGLVARDDGRTVWLAATRERRLHRLALAFDAEGAPRLSADATVDLDFAPDNLSLGDDGRLYVAGFPSLLHYGLFSAGTWGFGRSPTRVVSLDPDDLRAEPRLELDDDGRLISGGTIAVRYRQLLLIGSAYDQRLAICRAPDGP